MATVRLAPVVAILAACSPMPDPIGGAWQRIQDANGPLTVPGVDRLWLTLGGKFRRELPTRTYGGTYELDNFASTLDLHAGPDSWSGWWDLPPCPDPWTSRSPCALLYDGNGVRDLYRPLDPIGQGMWF